MTKETKFEVKKLSACAQDLVDEIEADFAELNQKIVRLKLIHLQVGELIRSDLDSRKDDQIDTLFQVNRDASRN